MKLIPAAATRINASLRCGTGLSTSLKLRASGPPGRSTTIAFTSRLIPPPSGSIPPGRLARLAGSNQLDLAFPRDVDDRDDLVDRAAAMDSRRDLVAVHRRRAVHDA